jgi:hypothetical protein
MLKMEMQAETPKATNERTPYRTPKLVRYGTIASVTMGGSTPNPVESIFDIVLST